MGSSGPTAAYLATYRALGDVTRAVGVNVEVMDCVDIACKVDVSIVGQGLQGNVVAIQSTVDVQIIICGDRQGATHARCAQGQGLVVCHIGRTAASGVTHREAIDGRVERVGKRSELTAQSALQSQGVTRNQGSGGLGDVSCAQRNAVLSSAYIAA